MGFFFFEKNKKKHLSNFSWGYSFAQNQVKSSSACMLDGTKTLFSWLDGYMSRFIGMPGQTPLYIPAKSLIFYMFLLQQLNRGSFSLIQVRDIYCYRNLFFLCYAMMLMWNPLWRSFIYEIRYEGFIHFQVCCSAER